MPRGAVERTSPTPEALKPQSWAARAPLLALRTLLGLDVINGELRCRPHLPQQIGNFASETSMCAADTSTWARTSISCDRRPRESRRAVHQRPAPHTGVP